jgi:hypothetical protein
MISGVRPETNVQHGIVAVGHETAQHRNHHGEAIGRCRTQSLRDRFPDCQAAAAADVARGSDRPHGRSRSGRMRSREQSRGRRPSRRRHRCSGPAIRSPSTRRAPPRRAAAVPCEADRSTHRRPERPWRRRRRTARVARCGHDGAFVRRDDATRQRGGLARDGETRRRMGWIGAPPAALDAVAARAMESVVAVENPVRRR